MISKRICKETFRLGKFRSGAMAGGKLFGPCYAALHNVYFVKYDVTVSFVAQVLDTVTYLVSHVFLVDTVTCFDIFW